jgi:hypothetical protein
MTVTLNFKVRVLLLIVGHCNWAQSCIQLVPKGMINTFHTFVASCFGYIYMDKDGICCADFFSVLGWQLMKAPWIDHEGWSLACYRQFARILSNDLHCLYVQFFCQDTWSDNFLPHLSDDRTCFPQTTVFFKDLFHPHNQTPHMDKWTTVNVQQTTVLTSHLLFFSFLDRVLSLII